MYIFKTSGKTFKSVIHNQKHAFSGMPKNWTKGELVLVSKNKADCLPGERQIQYTMRIDNIRPLIPGEADKYWPGNENRWRYMVECKDCIQLKPSFNLEEIISSGYRRYSPVMTYAKLLSEHETMIGNYLKRLGVL